MTNSALTAEEIETVVEVWRALPPGSQNTVMVVPGDDGAQDVQPVTLGNFYRVPREWEPMAPPVTCLVTRRGLAAVFLNASLNWRAEYGRFCCILAEQHGVTGFRRPIAELEAGLERMEGGHG